MLTRILVTVLALVAALPASAGDFTIDPVHSSVAFKVGHLTISKVSGSFLDFAGTIHLDQQEITSSSVAVTIEVASINTANEQRDTHLKSADFFDAEQYPQITFTSTSVTRRGSGYVATGDLTIKGTTHQVDLPFTINGPITDPWGASRIGVEIEPITINRQDYGITYSETLDTGGLLVGNEVEIELAVEAAKEDKAAKESKAAKENTAATAPESSNS